MTGDTLYTVEGLSAKFHDPLARRLVPAIDGVDLQIHTGECLGVTGESGGGKSTLARALVGLVRGVPGVTGGVFRWQGRELLADFPHATHPIERHWRRFLFRHWQGVYRRRTGRLRGREVFFVPQDPRAALNPYLSVGRQLAECGAAPGPLLAQVALDPALARRHPHELSTGMCQRVLVAMALALPCKIVLADEPVAKLDLRLRRRVVELLARIPASGRALVLFTHQLDLIAHLADRVAVLFRGAIVEQGSRAAVLGAGPHHPYTELLFSAGAGGEPAAPLTARADGGCPYRARCPLPRVERCAAEPPPLLPLGEGHAARCWVRAVQ